MQRSTISWCVEVGFGNAPSSDLFQPRRPRECWGFKRQGDPSQENDKEQTEEVARHLLDGINQAWGTEELALLWEA